MYDVTNMEAGQQLYHLIYNVPMILTNEQTTKFNNTNFRDELIDIFRNPIKIDPYKNGKNLKIY